MPHIAARDGIRLYYEEAGSGHAGDFRARICRRLPHVGDADAVFLPRASLHHLQPARLSAFGRSLRSGAKYSQDIARDDVLAVMDALKVEKAHVVGHSMGAYTALHVGIHAPERCISVVAAGCGWGSSPDVKKREEMKALAAETGKMFAEEGIAAAAAKYADAPMRQAQKNKDPRGYAEFARMLAEHSAEGHAQTMFNLQLKRPTLWEMEAALKKFSVPLLIIVGDEDEPCIDGSVFLKRTVPTAGLLVIPRSGHNVPTEEPATFNAALADLFAAAEAGRWLAHKPH